MVRFLLYLAKIGIILYLATQAFVDYDLLVLAYNWIFSASAVIPFGINVTNILLFLLGAYVITQRELRRSNKISYFYSPETAASIAAANDAKGKSIDRLLEKKMGEVFSTQFPPIIPGRPSMGAWTNYGLGSLSDNLPGYVVLTSAGGGQGQPISARQWHNGFLPSKHQGVELRSQSDPVYYVSNPDGISRESQGDLVETINSLNTPLSSRQHDPEIATRIAQYELAYQMQASVPELANFSDEPENILELYGCEPGDGTYASNCLMARRLAERGVRFIQLYHRGWDHHGGLKKNFTAVSELVDKPTAALIKDLKMRGLLDETLIIWGGEFGRTPMSQGASADGRDHHIKGFSIFLAGGGIQGGTVYGATDEFGYAAQENPTAVHDLHATMLHLLGIDHKRLTYRFQGRDFRLTDVHGHLIDGVLA